MTNNNFIQKIVESSKRIVIENTKEFSIKKQKQKSKNKNKLNSNQKLQQIVEFLRKFINEFQNDNFKTIIYIKTQYTRDCIVFFFILTKKTKNENLFETS